MILTNLIKNVIGNRAAPVPGSDSEVLVPSLLNVGGSSKQIPIPAHYEGWAHLLLDIAPGPDVDLVLDARKLGTLDAGGFDAIYCSHNLEHYFRHDGDKVLAGFHHVLKPNGFAEICVPDMPSVLRAMVSRELDIDDELYVSLGGPITVHDVIYGWRLEIERQGNDFFAHKRGFSVESMRLSLEQAGFQYTVLATDNHFNLNALAFKNMPTDAQKAMFGL